MKQPTQTVFATYMMGANVDSRFMQCWQNLLAFDLGTNKRIWSGGTLANRCDSGNIVSGRNDIAKTFIASECDWLFCVDSDMTFAPDVVERLIASADPVEKPIVGALCFALKNRATGEAGTYTHEIMPTIYVFTEKNGKTGVLPITNYATDSVLQVGATGMACILIHRSVFEAMEQFEDHWFDRIVIPSGGGFFGEDLSFCLRATQVEKSIFVDTSVRTGHAKTVFIDENAYQTQRSAVNVTLPSFAVIPVKDRLDLTRSIVEQLHEQGECTEIVVCDNGSTGETAEWLAEQQMATVLNCKEANIHEMWNRGVKYCRQKAPYSNVAILNNDLKLGPKFISGLAKQLRADSRLVAVSPNYDDRPAFEPLQMVKGICAGRYDGTGGLAGFAFMVRSEFFDNYQFPEDLQWWYGDNDFCLTVAQFGLRYAIVTGTSCEHIGGGSQSTKSLDLTETVKRDEATFKAKWVQS